VKPSTCKVCRCEYVKARPLQKVCSPTCAITHSKELTERKKAKEAAQDRRQTREKLAKFKTPTQLEKECRDIVQEIARLRDRHDGCISCHVGPNYGGRWHGSHFRPAGNNAAVQFHLWNIHKACAQCNLFKGGNLSEYRPRLVEKIGADRVAWLESQTQQVKTNVAYCERFKSVMGKRLRRMKKRIERLE